MKRPRYFQWLHGENAGIITKLVNITEIDGEYFYNFEDGDSCNLRFVSKMTSSPSELKDKFMVEVVSPNDPWRVEKIDMGFFKDAMSQENVDVPPLEDITGASGTGNSINISKSAVGTMKFIAPKYNGPMYELPSLDDYFYEDVHKEPVKKQKLDGATATFKKLAPEPEITMPSTPPPVLTSAHVNTTLENKNEDQSASDPVRILAKTCKKRDTDIDLTISIKLPSKAVYNIASAEFEDGGSKFINYLIEEIDINSIISELRNALTTAYESSNSE